MIVYIVRRLLAAVPIILGVNVMSFLLFFCVNTPEDMARSRLGQDLATPEQIDQWKRERNYHLPYFYNDGWQTEAVREIVQPGWLAPFGMPPGRYALIVSLPVTGKPVDLLLSAQPEGSVLLGTEWRRAHSEELDPSPEAFALEGAASLVPHGTRERRLELTLTSPRGSRVSVRIDLPGTLIRLARFRELGATQRLTETLFFQKSVKLLWLDFGTSDDGGLIDREILDRIPASLALTLPIFGIGLFTEILVAMILAASRGRRLDSVGTILCVFAMSVSIVFYAIFGQWLFAKTLRWVPISGFDGGLESIKFLVLPVLMGATAGLGVEVRWFRTVFLDEISRDYVRTARASGLSESRILFRHVLKNALIPILTGVMGTIPYLLIGSLVLESFFAIPGMGTFTIEGIRRQDFAVVQAMIFLASILQVSTMLVADLVCAWIDPRVRLS